MNTFSKPDRIRVITTVLDDKLPRRCFVWLESLGILPSMIVANIKSDLTAARNTAIRDKVLPVVDQYDAFLFLDGDIEPAKADEDAGFAKINRMFHEPSDVIGCMHQSGSRHYTPDEWIEPSAMHCSIFLCRSRVFKVPEMQAGPWFQFSYGPDKCDLSACDCDYFRKKAIAAGFRVSHAGVCHHRHESIWNH